ncbi:hypothetical protein G9A89_016937 [Geosiphon pyriformis]|nr:hypothetical protein G9A89_016937 [Geosiphon pyriformis]
MQNDMSFEPISTSYRNEFFDSSSEFPSIENSIKESDSAVIMQNPVIQEEQLPIIENDSSPYILPETTLSNDNLYTEATPLMTSVNYEIISDQNLEPEIDRKVPEIREDNYKISSLYNLIENIKESIDDQNKDRSLLSKNDGIFKNLVMYAKMANTAYCQPSQVTLKYFVTNDPNWQAIIIAFGGRESDLKEYIKNRAISYIEYPSSLDERKFHSKIYKYWEKERVNAAMYRTWLTAQQEFLERVEEIMKNNVNAIVRFIGHRLGGAFAVLAALAFLAKYPDQIIVVYTYGQPRIGNQKFVGFINQLIHMKKLQVLRATRPDDPIIDWPKMNFSASLSYTHCPTEYWYDEENDRSYQCRSQDGFKENSNCAASNIYNPNKKDGKVYFGVLMGTCLKEIATLKPKLIIQQQ